MAVTRLSEHFLLSEFTHTSYWSIKNVPPEQAIVNLAYGCTMVLEPLRQELGIPIIITSGYRSVELNLKVGGVHNSQHIDGCAADIKTPTTLALDDVWRWLQGCRFVDQCLGGKSFIHVSWSPFRRPRRYYVRNYYR